MLFTLEMWIRLAAFSGIFVAMAAWELLAPRRVASFSRGSRWPSNLGVVVVDTLIVRLVFPVAAVGVSLLAEQRDWGLFNVAPVPFWISIIGSIILLDFAIYLQHVLFHAVPALWRLHRMHHADLDFDVTTGLRFHPIEILLSMIIKMMVVAAIGAPAVAVVAFEVLLNGTSMFNHGNVRIHPALDRVLRWFLVTPDMHRVHHSILQQETNSNFGFNLSWWDRLFGTYRPQPLADHSSMTIGIDQFRDPSELRLDRMLLQPFRAEAGTYPIGVRDKAPDESSETPPRGRAR
jgi:sterol desaturase/sphingolipid hydroxylase (fatty acid hydroxylase superfamily)